MLRKYLIISYTNNESKVNDPVLARVPILIARLNVFLGNIRKVVNAFGKKNCYDYLSILRLEYFRR